MATMDFPNWKDVDNEGTQEMNDSKEEGVMDGDEENEDPDVHTSPGTPNEDDNEDTEDTEDEEGDEGDEIEDDDMTVSAKQDIVDASTQLQTRQVTMQNESIAAVSALLASFLNGDTVTSNDVDSRMRAALSLALRELQGSA